MIYNRSVSFFINAIDTYRREAVSLADGGSALPGRDRRVVSVDGESIGAIVHDWIVVIWETQVLCDSGGFLKCKKKKKKKKNGGLPFF